MGCCGAITVNKKIQNALDALGRVVNAAATGDQVFVNQQVKDRRLEVCKKCPSFEQGKCLRCGCFVDLKARLRTERCPEGKW